MSVSRAEWYFQKDVQLYGKSQISPRICDFGSDLWGLEADLFTEMKHWNASF
jgi:hypothetical protein